MRGRASLPGLLSRLLDLVHLTGGDLKALTMGGASKLEAGRVVAVGRNDDDEVARRVTFADLAAPACPALDGVVADSSAAQDFATFGLDLVFRLHR
jgi:hypothetical protein